MKQTIGFALTGSFCTLEKTFAAMEVLKNRYNLLPIVSERVAGTDTRFFKKEEVLERLESICGMPPLQTITDVEPLGPKNMLDLLVICPCTGNTLSKMALGITDTCVTMAAKSHRRRGGKLLVALSTNDALSGSSKSLGIMTDKKGVFFVPMKQDSPDEKPASLCFDPTLLPFAIDAALSGHQLQPFFLK